MAEHLVLPLRAASGLEVVDVLANGHVGAADADLDSGDGVLLAGDHGQTGKRRDKKGETEQHGECCVQLCNQTSVFDGLLQWLLPL